MKKFLIALVPLAIFAQVRIDTVIHLPTGSLRRAYYVNELNKLYVTGTDGYFVVDCSTYQVKTLIPARTGLARFAWNPRRLKLYITCNPRPDSTMIVDAAADTIIGWLGVGREMHEEVYLSDVDVLYKPAVETLYAFDGATDSVVRKLTLGGLNTNATWDSVGRKLYVGQGRLKKLYVYDYLADSVRKVIDVSSISSVQPDALVFNDTYRKGYVAPFQAEPWVANVGIIDTKSDTLLSVLPVRIWGGLGAQVAVNERDDKVYLADNDTYINTPDTLWVVDCETDSVLKKVEYAPRGRGAMPVCWVPWSNRLYMAITYPDGVHSSSIAVLDCSTDSLIIPAMLLNNGFIDDIQLDPVRQRVFAIGVDSSDIYVLRDTGYAGIAEGKPNGIVPSARAKARVVFASDGVAVEYHLPAATRVRATLHDAVGRRIGVLDAGERKAGLHQLSWNRDQAGRRLSAGAYFVHLDMGKEQARLKAVVR